MYTHNNEIIHVKHLFPKLDEKLLELLRGLTDDEWNMPTIAKLWRVKDIAAHLLDGNIRSLSIARDKYFGEPPANIQSYQDLVAYLNQLNADWVKAMRRMSPNLLIELLETTGKAFTAHMQSLDLFEQAIFSVSWAGESESVNWFHIAREYTEKWIHQQQIRSAVNKEGIMTKEFFYPLIDTLMRGLPHAFRDVAADPLDVIKVSITTEIGGNWYLYNAENRWQLSKNNDLVPSAEISLDPHTAWKLFSKGMTPHDAKKLATIRGNVELAETVLTMVSVMA